MKRNVLLFASLFVFSLISAQKQPISYFLPDITYDKNLPTPEAYLGFQIGEWHISHDQLLGYMKTLAAASPRAKLVEHGRTYENRPLVHLIITSEKNHKSLDELKAQHVALSNPTKSGSADLAKIPAVLYPMRLCWWLTICWPEKTRISINYSMRSSSFLIPASTPMVSTDSPPGSIPTKTNT